MLKTLAAQIKQYKRSTLLTPLFTVLEVVMEVLIPFVTAAIIDKGINAGDISKVYIYGGIMLVMAFMSLAFGVLAASSLRTLPRDSHVISVTRCSPISSSSRSRT